MSQPDNEARVEYRVLGPIQAGANGRPIVIGAGKQRALLALLLMNANTAVSVDRAVDALWNGRPPETAGKVVQVLVSQLRKAFGAGENECIVTIGGGYMLRVEPGQTDVDRFEGLLETGRRHLGDGHPHEAERTLSGALELWRGGAYEDVTYEDFARDEIARLEQRRLDAVEERFEALLADGRHTEAVSGLEKLVAQHPSRERLVALWMLALHRCGRRAEALDAYDQARRRLADEQGIAPGERLQRLHAAILESDETNGSAFDLELHRRRRAGRLMAIAAAVLLAAAVVAAIVVGRGGSSDQIEGLAGDSVGLIDPSSGRLVEQFPVGQTPSEVLARGHVAWTINGDSQTISRVDRNGRRDQAVPGAPTDLAWAAGSIWVSYSILTNDEISFGVLRLDPDTLRPQGQIDLNDKEPAAALPFAPLAVTGDRLWMGAPAGLLKEIDPAHMKVVRTVKIPDIARGLTADRHGLWVLLAEGTVLHINPATRRVTQRFTVNTPHALDIASAGGRLWVSDGFTGNVWRITPGPPVEMSSYHVGTSAFHIATTARAVWVTSSVDGTVARIDADSGRRRLIHVGNAPIGVAASGAGIWASVGQGAGAAVEAGGQGGALPVGNCEPLLYRGEGSPDVVVAVDLPLDKLDVLAFTGAMAQASEAALRQHDFKAGRYRVGMQLCDDASGGETGYWDPSKCAANAQMYVGTPKVVAVLAPFNSGCTATELPILNRASGGPVPIVSPANDWAGFTREARGNAADEPASHYPTGIRNFLRVYPSAIAEAKVDARLSKSLGAHRVLITLNPKSDGWETTIAWSFAAAARAQGISVVGPVILGDHVPATIERAVRRGVDQLYLASRIERPEIRALETARRLGGSGFPIMTWNSALYDALFWLKDVPEARGMYISGGYYLNPQIQLAAAGRRFMSTLNLRSNEGPGFAPFSAQAMDIVLAAVAQSDGSRQSMLQELFRTHVDNGILGTFGFQPSGDMTSAPFAIYRFIPGRPARFQPYDVLRVAPG